MYIYVITFSINKQGFFVTVVLSTASAAGNTCVQSSFNFHIFTSLSIWQCKQIKSLTPKCKLLIKYQQQEMNDDNGHEPPTICKYVQGDLLVNEKISWNALLMVKSNCL